MRRETGRGRPDRRRHSVDKRRQAALLGPSGFGVGWVVRRLISHVEARGFDAASIRGLPGLRGRDLEDPDALFPEPALRQAWRLAVALTGDGALGLHLAEQLPRGTLDLIEYSFRASPTLGDAIQRLARYGRLLNDRLAARVLVGSGNLRFLIGEPAGQVLDRQRAELSLAFLLRLARETTVGLRGPLEVSFAHQAPEGLSEHRRFFRAPLRFSAAISEIVFSGRDAARPLRSADEGLLGAIKRRLEKQLVRLGKPAGGSTTARVRELLVHDLGMAGASAARAAHMLGLGERTLSRSLATEGTSFRAILESVRSETAAALLHDRSVAIAEISYFLGYSEPAAFHRSFKRWTGKTPLAYRRDGSARMEPPGRPPSG
jgi:AraC-like DNA-binding protein